MLEHLLIYLLSFFIIWIGAGLAIKSVERLSRSLKVSSFAVSFLVLGFFTSVSELSVGINAVVANDPEIYVGNLIGASIVIFLMIIPLLAVCAKGLKVNHGFKGFNLFLSMLVIGAPVILSMDGKIDRFDSLISIISYFVLVVCIQMRKGLLERVDNFKQLRVARVVKELGKMIVGIVLIFFASKFVVDETLYFSTLLSVSPFLISLLLISIGTNIPELSLTVRTIFMKNNQVAFGDFVGSAAFNTFLFGALTLIYGKTVYLTHNYLVSLFFLISALFIFYYFARKDHEITRGEGIILLLIYTAFLFVEIIMH
jgi:cation:H+ antiporter